ncbi:MAG: class C sortase [Coriobacteriaceae bacterium]|nr:class C sortase [Coriobacteriaceae bacterium]
MSKPAKGADVGAGAGAAKGAGAARAFQGYLAKYVLAALLFSVGASIFLYPAVSALINERAQTVVVRTYNEAVQETPRAVKEISLEQARAYNLSLVGRQPQLLDPFDDAHFRDSSVVTYLKIGDVMGYVEVPKIGITVPIYEGTSDAVLSKGVGWIPETSLPVGGESTHTVLSGHNGLPTARLFTDINKLEPGDEFFIRNFAEILAYRVYDIQVVEPHEVEIAGIVTGKDLATLLTCYPYMVNSHRLLVTGERVAYTGQLDKAPRGLNPLEDLTPVERNFVVTLTVVLGLLALLVVLAILLHRRRRRRGNRGKADGS